MITDQAVMQFTTSDGSKFLDRQRAESYEAEWQSVKPILDQIPQVNLGHGQFKSVPAEVLQKIRRDLWPVVVARYGSSWPKWREWQADEVHPMSIVGRVLSDCGGPIADCWNRLMVFDFERGRIYDQPYFVSHPNEAEEAC